MANSAGMSTVASPACSSRPTGRNTGLMAALTWCAAFWLLVLAAALELVR
jgi:hypothetical protein